MLQVRGDANPNTKAIQVILKTRHLNDFTNNIDFQTGPTQSFVAQFQ